MPWGDFSCDEIAQVLGCQRTKATQAVGPALVKIAALYRYDPIRTMQAIVEVDRLMAQGGTTFALPKSINGKLADRITAKR